MLDHAIDLGYCDKNHARKLEIKKNAIEEKVVWSDDEVARVSQALEARDKFGWMHVTFLMSLYQAARLRQAQIPLCSDIMPMFDAMLLTPKAGVKTSC